MEPTHEFNTDNSLQNIVCTPLFVVPRAGLPTDWIDENGYLVCDENADPDFYNVDTDAITDLSQRLEWNQKNQEYIDFNKSEAMIVDRHPAVTGASGLVYKDTTKEEIERACGGSIPNIYDYFVAFDQNTDGSIAVSAINDPSKSNIFSLPFINAILKLNSTDLLGVNFGTNSVNLKCGSQYYNMSNDPTK